MKTRTLVLAILLTCVLSVSATYFVIGGSSGPRASGREIVKDKNETNPEILVDCCRLTLFRESHSEWISPLLFEEDTRESELLMSLKDSLTNKIQALKASGKLNRASVYFKDQSSTRWTGVGSDENYYPGSMLKVALMMHLLHRSEINSTLLQTKVLCERPGNYEVVVPPSQRLIAGKSYSVRELIEAMIVRSDNDAAFLLQQFIDEKEYQEMYSTLGITAPAMDDWYYQISPQHYARFFRVLHNASYLNHENSDFAMGLLAGAEYDLGLTKYLPPNSLAAHKFGERFTEGELKQFHETAFVRSGGRNFIICIMTEGKDFAELQSAVAEIAKVSFGNW